MPNILLILGFLLPAISMIIIYVELSEIIKKRKNKNE